MAIFVRKSIRRSSEIHFYDDCRLLGISVTIDSDVFCFLNVYKPYQCNDNYDLFIEYIGKIYSVIEDSCSTNVIVLSDFNAAVNSTFENELIIN